MGQEVYKATVTEATPIFYIPPRDATRWRDDDTDPRDHIKFQYDFKDGKSLVPVSPRNADTLAPETILYLWVDRMRNWQCVRFVNNQSSFGPLVQRPDALAQKMYGQRWEYSKQGRYQLKYIYQLVATPPKGRRRLDTLAEHFQHNS